MSIRSVLTVLVASVALAGCGALPVSGPSAMDISSRDIESMPSDFVVTDLTPETANIVSSYLPEQFATTFGAGSGVSGQVLGVGDAVVVSIWEASANGLFSSDSDRSTQIPGVIDQQGRIYVPFVGSVEAAGRTVEQIRSTIQAGLEDKAIEPQVTVNVEENVTNSVVVVGDVVNPGKYPIALNGTRILDLVALAGGARENPYETTVTLRRGSATDSILLEELFDLPRNNVMLRAEDSILLTHTPRSFSAFGAVGRPTQVQFESRTVVLSEALARVGGLNDNRADAGGVFLFRFEPAEVANLLKPGLGVPRDVQAPVVYKLDFRDPQAFFLARNFQMRDKDIIFVANAPSVELGKFLSILQPLFTTTRQIEVVAQ